MPLKWLDIDKQIWQEELDYFVPSMIFDIHTHLYRWSFNLNINNDTAERYRLIGESFPDSSWNLLNSIDRLLLPERQIHRLSFAFPFCPSCDIRASNEFAASQVLHDPQSAALMLTQPSMSADYLRKQIEQFHFVGFKPYPGYAAGCDTSRCRITDFIPQTHIDVADKLGLLIMMHLSKQTAVTDSENLQDLRTLTDKYPNAKLILAHCARSYSSRPIEKAKKHLSILHNVWYDVSSVCESEAIEALISAVGPERVMYGSDNLPVGAMRGKYITFGYGWTYLGPNNHLFDLSHCNPQMTFVLYEQLRAMRTAAEKLRLNDSCIQQMFFGTAAALVDSVRRNA